MFALSDRSRTSADPPRIRDYPVLTDDKTFFAGLIQHVYGQQQASLEHIFTGIKPKDLNLV